MWPLWWFCQLSLSSFSCVPILYSLKICCMFLRGITLFSVAKMGYYIGGAQFFFFFNFYLPIVVLQCCVGFRCTTKWISPFFDTSSLMSTALSWHVKFQGCWLLSDHSFWLLHKMRWQWFQFVWLQREARQCLSPMSLGQFLWNWAFPKEQCDSQPERESPISPSLGKLRRGWLFCFFPIALLLSLSFPSQPY